MDMLVDLLLECCRRSWHARDVVAYTAMRATSRSPSSSLSAVRGPAGCSAGRSDARSRL